VVFPAAALATHYNRRAFVAEINPEATAISERVDFAIRKSAAEALPIIVNAYQALRA
jgi:NAD-dependent SIR2 family protein deacetylase